MTPRNWKRVQPTSLRNAMELCKDKGIAAGLSVQRIADRTALVDHWTLYKWISTGRMPVSYVRAFETVCRADYITRWLAVSGGKLVIDIPAGRDASAEDMQALQELLNTAVGQLLAFHAGRAQAPETLAAISQAMEGLAWHRLNVEKHGQPELALAGED